MAINSERRTFGCELTVGLGRGLARGMLSPRGLEAKIFGLGLVASVLVLMQCLPRSHEGCPRGLVVSHRNHVIYVMFDFSDTKLLQAACFRLIIF